MWRQGIVSVAFTVKVGKPEKTGGMLCVFRMLHFIPDINGFPVRYLTFSGDGPLYVLGLSLHEIVFHPFNLESFDEQALENLWQSN